MEDGQDLISKVIAERSTNQWWLDSEAKVLGRFSPIFRPENLDNLTKEAFLPFLLGRNNLHWDGIHRQENLITSDMDKLRQFLNSLLNENIPLRERLNKIFNSKGGYNIKGLGKAVATPILLVVYPDKYGVWNAKSEAALKKLGLFPQFSSGDSFGDKYVKVNAVLLDLAEKYRISLWKLDGILGEIATHGPFDQPIEGSGLPSGAQEEVEVLKEEGVEDIANFGMESHLEDFIITNWDKMVFSRDYELIYDENDETELKSQQFSTVTGPIDILAKSKTGSGYLVIELKKGWTSDAVVGQILRYMAWVKENLATDNGAVRGAVVVQESDQKLKYALRCLNNVTLYNYQVSFKLNEELN